MIAGIDFDTRAVHVVLLDDDDQARYFRFDLCATGDAFDRTRVVREAMPARTAVFWDGVIAIGLENPTGPAMIATRLMRVQGAILACLPGRVLVAPLGASEWRVRVGLSGRAPKIAVASWSIEHGGLLAWPQDAHDAHAIAHATRHLVSIGQLAA